MKDGTALIGAGFALIAATYGLARFAYGLFLPSIGPELDLDATEAGVIGAAAFAAYCVAICLASAYAARLGPRLLATLAGMVATLGMAWIAVAQSPWSLGAAVAFSGLSTGLASPPLAAAVSVAIAPGRQDFANTAINSGTSAGIVVSGPVALLLTGAWREAYLVFSGMALLVTIWIWFSTPARSAPGTIAFSWTDLATPALRPVIPAAFLMGVGSTAVWTFGGDILQALAGWTEARIASVWIVIGAAGFAGAFAGAFVSRFGVDAIHRGSLAAMSVSLVMLGLFATVLPSTVLVAAALFGAAYIMSTGVMLVWGVMALPTNPALGLGVSFLAVSIGQVIGAPLFGMIYDSSGAVTALMSFALVCIGATLFRHRPANA